MTLLPSSPPHLLPLPLEMNAMKLEVQVEWREVKKKKEVWEREGEREREREPLWLRVPPVVSVLTPLSVPPGSIEHHRFVDSPSSDWWER